MMSAVESAIPAAEIVATHAEAEACHPAPTLVLDGIAPFVPGDGPISADPLGAGHSNLTFRITRDGRSYVLRRPPRPPYAPTAHDVLREHRVLTALAELNVRVPHVVSACADDAAIGAPFYLMEEVQGEVVRDCVPRALADVAQRRRIGEELIDALVELHAADWQTSDLKDIGRPTGYLERQVRRWSAQWQHARTRQIPTIDRVGELLEKTVPTGSDTTLVHGDYKLDNALFAPAAPARVVAVLDWEMATLGDPLADLGYLIATWSEPAEAPDEVLDFSPVTRMDGFLTRNELVARYATRSGRSTAQLDWYQALALWKLAILFEGSYRRHLAGVADDPFFARLKEGVPRLAQRALDILEPTA
jgi:aminoglycoside phosphotransferase (APT) family kinase protein